MERQALQIFDDLPAPADIRSEVLAGLNSSQKTLPAKYFYDERGSRLFEEITHLPEYYLTRTEIGLLREYADEIAEIIGRGSVLLEYGSGASIKIRLLLEALRPQCYVPMDISREFLIASASRLLDDYEWLNIYAACVDYSQNIALPDQLLNAGTKMAFFPGSSMGNFTPEQASDFLCRVRSTLGDGGYFLLGVDLLKDESILQAAYDDSQGVTAAFNKNVLRHLNRTLDGQFNEDRFEHKIVVNHLLSRVEMHLVSSIDQMVNIAGNTIALRSGETIHTENSYKYRLEHLIDMAGSCGFECTNIWTDSNEYYALIMLKCGS